MSLSLSRSGILSAVVVLVQIPVLIFAIRIMVSSKNHLRSWLTLPACIVFRLAGSILLIAYDFLPWAFSAHHLIPVLCFALDVCNLWALVICAMSLRLIMTEGAVVQPEDSSSMPGHRVVNTGLGEHRLLILATLPPFVWTILFIVIWGLGLEWGFFYFALFGLLVVSNTFIRLSVITVYTWFRFERMLHYRKRFYGLIIFTLPLIAVRTGYNFLNGLMLAGVYAPSLARFNMFTGDFRIYVIMDLLMDSVVVMIYTVAGLKFPLDEDYQLIDEYPFPRLEPLLVDDT